MGGGKLNPSAIRTLRHRLLGESTGKNTRLQALWALHVTNGLDEELLLTASRDDDPDLRAWAVRLIVDHGQASEKAIARFVAMAKTEPSPRVRLYLASAAQRLSPLTARTPLLAALAGRVEDHADAVLQRMLWYALEPALAESPKLATSLSRSSSNRLTKFIARRLMEPDLAETPSADLVASLIEESSHPTRRAALFQGAMESVVKHPNPRLPQSWNSVLTNALENTEPVIRQEGLRLAMVVEHAPTLKALIASVDNGEQDIEQRLRDLEPLLTVNESPEIDALCRTLLHHGPPRLRAAVIPTLPQRKITRWESWLLDNWTSLESVSRTVAVEALSARRESASLLVAALADGELHRTEITASQAQKMAAMKDPDLSDLLETHWGSVQQSSQAKRETINRYRALLTTSARKPNLNRGRALYSQSCAACHRLFDEGGQLGPDLTGSDRGNLDYLLNNIIDPSASVAADYRLTVATTKGGRVLAGALVESDRSGIVIRTLTGEERLANEDVRNRRLLKSSLMPEGLFQTLTDDDVIDLIGYLRTRVSAP